MKVKIYTTSTCHFCHEAKDFMKERKIAFEEVDLEGNEKAQKEIMDKVGQLATPIINVGGKFIVGFNREKLAEVLGVEE